MSGAKYQPFNDLGVKDFDALKDDINLRGVLYPIYVDEKDVTIDGHQRRRACAELHIDCPRIIVEGLSEDEKVALSVALNAFRRHLSGPERLAAISRLARLGWSARRIGSTLGVSHQTVLRATADEDDLPETRVGADGKPRPASRPTGPDGPVEPPEHVDPTTGEITSGSEPGEGEGGPDGQGTSGNGEGVGDEVPAPTPSAPESKADRDARIAAEQVAERNKAFGQNLIGFWTLLGTDGCLIPRFLEEWNPDQCPMFGVIAHQPVFTGEGMHRIADLIHKLAEEWEHANG